MKMLRPPAVSFRRLLAGSFALLASHAFAADRVELTDGSVITGKLLSAEGGKFKVATAFVGTLEIAQDNIERFSTDEAVTVEFASGDAVLGKVDAADTGIRVPADGGPIMVDMANVAAVWRPGGESPALRRLKEEAAKKARHWAYEASVAIAGRSGASEKFGANLGFKATLASARDKLVLALAAQTAKDNGVETADRQFTSADYSSFYSPDNGWYARSSLETDAIKKLELRSTNAFGAGRKLLKQDRQTLEFRLGASYLRESYTNDTDFESPGMDVALLHNLAFPHAAIVTAVRYTPAFREFANYRLHLESACELPIGAALWKLKLGIANDFLSRPPAGAGRLDTTYFTSLLLNWQ